MEIEQIKEYQVFKDYGKAVYEKDKIGNAPKGYQEIRVHLIAYGSCKVHEGIDVSFHNTIALFSFVLMLMVWF